MSMTIEEARRTAIDDWFGKIFQSEAERSSRASDEAAGASVSERTRARELHRLEAQADRLSGELAALKDGSYNPREHPSRRARLASLLAHTNKTLRNLMQRRLL
jgi:hypothetical protein